ncbi:unknown [Prevotella sp. CAG:255]|nr:unknown [Prevotella sp. CAG:255]
MSCNGKNYRITNSCGVGLHLTKEKEVQDFFHKLGVILIYAGYLEIKGCILLTMK